ncbi:type VII secretion system-associated protein [Micromonospora sp. GCM10011542]|uniref:type VII secretion system-associated protein n=1 Tax=Micromonospora sp. GCM10011542 TaxID=3317337 RepID=UPI0036171FAA
MNERNESTSQRNWMLLLDSEWDGSGDEGPDAADVPPVETIVGGWLVDEDGTVGPFEANPLYRPRNADSPTSPVDAAVKLVATGRADTDLILLALRDSVVEVALDETGDMLVASAPDGVACVVVVTGAADQARLDVPGWRQVDLYELLRLLPTGLDVLLNPAGPRAMRLLASALRGAAGQTTDEPATP